MADISFIPIRILLVEDTPSDAVLLQECLATSDGGKYDVHHATSLGDALHLLGKYSFRAVILDLSLPDANGLEGLEAIHQTAPIVPIIILTGLDDEKTALKAVENGAQDYLVKDTIDHRIITRAINYAIQRKRFESNIVRQANFDKLTGLANRILFDSRLTMALMRTARSGTGVGLLFIDLDDFKQVNDTLGHLAGDQVLREISGHITKCVRPYDTAARLGGDEFAVLVEGISQPRDCVTIAMKLIDSINTPIVIDGQEIKVGVSIGIETCWESDILTPEIMIKHADEAMYHAKLNKGSTYSFYTRDMEEIQKVRMQMEGDLRYAIVNDELVLCYQPKQSLVTGKTCGVEALLRWTHPTHGMVMPRDFIGIAKDINMLEDIEKWVLRKVCEDIKRWRDIDLPFTQVSVNLSAQVFDAPYFISYMQSLMEENSIERNQLSLELPESIFLLTDEIRIHKFSELYKMGIGITMDRFSVETSSLLSLKALMLNEIKFGNEFIENAEENAEDMRLLKMIITCAHSMGLRVIACGVESNELRNCLKRERCDTIQGFIFSRPMPASYLEKWFRNETLLIEEEVREEKARNEDISEKKNRTGSS